MPPAIIAVAAAVASYAVTTYVSSAILAAILLVAISVAASALTKKPKNTTGSVNQGAELSLKLDATMPRQFPVGRTASGGSLVWAFTYPTTGTSTIPPNRYLVRIIDLSDLPIEGVVTVMEGKTALTFVGGDIHTNLVACDQHRKKDGSASMWLQVYKGSATPTADANLISWSGGLWTSAHKGTNIAYAILRYDYDSDAFPNGEPALSFIMDGVKCYDDRYDTSTGGSGTQRLATPSTWAYSRNAGVIAAQMMRGFFSAGVLLFGAQAQAQDLSTTMLYAAHNTCDEAVSITGGGTQPRYRAGMMISAGDSTQSALLDMQAAMDGRIIDRGGQITILPGAIRTAVFDLSDADVAWTNESSWQPKASLSDLTNHIVGTFVDETQGYTEQPFPTLRNPTWETNDGGERFSTQYAFKAVTNNAQVQRITKRIHEASRYQGTVAFVMPLWGIEMEQGDWFTMTSLRKGFSGKTFEVKNLDVSSELKVVVFAREVSSSSSTWSAANEVARTDTTWSGPSYALPVPTVTVTADRDYNDTYRTETVYLKVNITDVPTMGTAQQIELEYGLTADLSAPSKVAKLAPINQIYVIGNRQPMTSYSVRGRTSDGASVSDWSSWVAVTTPAVNNISLNAQALGGTAASTVLAQLGAATTDVAAANAALAAQLITLNSHTTTLTANGLALADLTTSGAATAASLHQRTRDADTIAQAVLRAGIGANTTRTTMRDAGITVDANSGVVSLYSVDYQAERINNLSITLDATNASIALKASSSYVDAAIAAAAIPGSTAALDTIFTRLTNAETNINGLTASVALKADATTVTGLSGTVTTLSTTLSALSGTVSTKADTTTVTAIDSRVSSVEGTLSTLGNVVGISTSIRQTRLISDAGALASLYAAVDADQASRQVISQVSGIQQELTTKIVADVLAEAALRTVLEVRMGAAEASVTSEVVARVTATDAITSRLTIAEATMNNPVTGVVATYAKIAAEETNRALADTALSGSISTLSAQVNNGMTGLAATYAAVTSASDAQATINTATANSITAINTIVNDSTTGLAAAHTRITSEINTRSSADGAIATSVDALSATVGGHTASITSLTSAVVTAGGGVTTKAVLALNADGYISGLVQTNNGTIANATFVADYFAIVAPGGGARTEYSSGNWRIYDASNNLVARWGIW